MILERFRRGAGVPSAAADDVAAELAPLFAALDEIEEEAERRREAARARGRAYLDDASEEAHGIVAAYRDRAEAVHRRAVERSRGAAEEQSRALVADAERHARDIQARGEERLPQLVAAVVACVREGAR